MNRETTLRLWVVCMAFAVACPATAAEEVNVMRATGISIDGDPAEWNLGDFTTYSEGGADTNGDIVLVGYHDHGGGGMAYYGASNPGDPIPTSTADFRARVWSRHDDTYLYFLVRFDDDDKQTTYPSNWANDCVEFYIDPDNNGGSSPLSGSETSDCQLVIDRANVVAVYMTTPTYRDQILAGVTSATVDIPYEGYAGTWFEVRILKTALDSDLPAGSGDFGVNFNFRDQDVGELNPDRSILDWAGDYSTGGFPNKIPDNWGDALLDSTDIPNLTLYAKEAGTITIDGDASDWNLATFTTRINGGTSGSGDIAFVGYDSGSVYRGGFCPGFVMPESAADHSVRVYSMHDASYQYFLARLEDDDLQSPNGVGANWANDCIEFYLDPGNDGGSSPLGGSEASDFQLVIDVANQQNVYHATAPYAAQILGGVTSVVTTDGTGWTLEVRIDKTVADPDVPADGVFGMDLNFRDNDSANEPSLTSIYSWRDPYHEGTSPACPTKRPKNWGDVDNVECTINADCDNSAWCDGAETCDIDEVCQAGTAPNCDDGVGCTNDSCDESNDVCVNAPSNGLCDNGDFCDGAETCDDVLDCVAGTAPDCTDTVSCTVDSCDELNDVCVNAPSNGLCDNGDWCDGAEICDDVLDCVPGTAPDCTDTVGCTVDSCDELNDVCVNAPSNGLCDNGDFCDGAEFCDEFLDCQVGTDPCLLTQWCYEMDDQCVNYGDGDSEPDGDVDLVDFQIFQQCFGQLGLGDCQPANMAGDGIIGPEDIEAFAPALSASGPQ